MTLSSHNISTPLWCRTFPTWRKIKVCKISFTNQRLTMKEGAVASLTDAGHFWSSLPGGYSHATWIN